MYDNTEKGRGGEKQVANSYCYKMSNIAMLKIFLLNVRFLMDGLGLGVQVLILCIHLQNVYVCYSIICKYRNSNHGP